MFLGCSPCCGGSCPNYYDILDSADELEFRPLVYFDDGTGTGTRFELFDNVQTGIGQSQDLDLSSIKSSWVGTGYGGSVLFKPHNKVKNNHGLLMMRAYDPSGNSTSGDNYYEVAATPYSLTVTVNVRTASSFHRWYIQEHKCTLPNTFIYTQDGIDTEAAAYLNEWRTRFVPFYPPNTWQDYTVSQGNCQFLIFGCFSSYETPPVPRDSDSSSESPTYHGARNGLFLQDWSFIYPMAGTHERQVWEQNGKSYIGTRLRQLESGTSFPIKNWYRTDSLSDENTEYVLDEWSSLPLSYFRGDWDMGGGGEFNINGWSTTNPIGNQGNDASMQVAMCVRPFEKTSLADRTGIQQTRQLTREHFNETRTFAARGTQEYFAYDALWAWADGQRIDLMKTQPAYADPNTHWQSLGTMAADMEYDLFKVLRAYGYYHPSTTPTPLAGSCVGMGPADWGA